MKNKLITLTTKEHYNKYSNLAKGIKKEILLNLVRDLYKDIDELKQKFKEDLHLNNINIKQIDFKFSIVRSVLSPKIRYKENGKYYTCLSLADSCSFIKHILVFKVLKIKPFFEEDIKNYKELYKIWYNLGNNKISLDMWFIKNKDKWII